MARTRDTVNGPRAGFAGRAPSRASPGPWKEVARTAILSRVDTSRAWAEIDLDALSHNLAVLRRKAGPGVALLLVAKADAYGHGAVAVAHHALRHGADGIGVTTCEEALELRRAGIRCRIVVLGAVFGDETPEALEQGVEIGIPSAELCRMLERTARRVARRARVHLKVDTGMNRLGVPPEEALEVLARVRGSLHLELAGVMTHLAPTDGALAPAAHEQMRRFQAVLEEARARRLLEGKRLWIHAANSAAILTGLDPLHDAVRPGIGAYGVAPDPRVDATELRPVMSVHTKIVHLRRARPGEEVGYGGSWRAPGPGGALLATLPLGYADGLGWRLGNRGRVLVRGTHAPLVGRISMDYATVDVGGVPGVRLGDRVTLFGRDGAAWIRVEELAQEAGTIPYEVLCSIGKRVDRVYRGGAPEGRAPD